MSALTSFLARRRGSQVVRSRSAKPLFAGSIPAPACFCARLWLDTWAFTSSAGSIDSVAAATSPYRSFRSREPLSNARSVAYLRLTPGERFRDDFRLCNFATAESAKRGERTPVTQASACALRLIHALLRRCSRRLFRGMLARTVSFYDRFSAKRRPGFRRKERS